jgi:hypothetical protein
MLKTLLLSGWFHAQPFAKYVVVVMLIAPLMAASTHATSAKKSELASVAIDSESSIPSAENIVVSELGSIGDISGLPADTSNSQPSKVAIVTAPNLLQTQENSSQSEVDDSQLSDLTQDDPFAKVEVAPWRGKNGVDALSSQLQQQSLIQKLKAAREQNLAENNGVLYAAKIDPLLRGSGQDLNPVPTDQMEPQTQQESEDPLNSPYPIPMKWINQTQETVGASGGGVRYYRSSPVTSPDGRYRVYSRIQLEVKPEQHNSRVSSVLFIEDRQNKKLRVVASTSRNNDVLVNTKAAPDANGEGTIGVLVPVSWSERGDRFLARRFEGVMNTSDMSDYAVIWHRERDRVNTVEPARKGGDHEKIAILLGWNKNQPNHVMFRTGELGDEDWPLVNVSDEGKTTGATDIDQPVTFGNRVSDVWAGPQVAYR